MKQVRIMIVCFNYLSAVFCNYILLLTVAAIALNAGRTPPSIDVTSHNKGVPNWYSSIGRVFQLISWGGTCISTEHMKRAPATLY